MPEYGVAFRPRSGRREQAGYRPHRTMPGTMLPYRRPRPWRLVVARHRWRGERARGPSPGASLEGTGWSSGLLCGLSDPPCSTSAERTPCRERPRWPNPAPPGPLPDGLLNRGVMPLPQLTVHRHDRRTRTLITLVGEIDLESAPLVCASLEWCLRDGIRTLDVDLTLVTFCDCSGLNAFLHAAQRPEWRVGPCDCTTRRRYSRVSSASPTASSCSPVLSSSPSHLLTAAPRSRPFPPRRTGLPPCACPLG